MREPRTWPEIERERWAIWQLAYDQHTYGSQAGLWIVVTEDREDETDHYPMSQAAAQAIADRHNREIEGIER